LFRRISHCHAKCRSQHYLPFSRIDVGLVNTQLKFYKSFGCAEHYWDNPVNGDMFYLLKGPIWAVKGVQVKGHKL
jgi:hypothetical protein